MNVLPHHFYQDINLSRPLKFICYLLCGWLCWALRRFCFKDSQVHKRNRKQTAQRLILSGAAEFRERLREKHREVQTRGSLLWMGMTTKKKSKGPSPESSIQVDTEGVRTIRFIFQVH